MSDSTRRHLTAGVQSTDVTEPASVHAPDLPANRTRLVTALTQTCWADHWNDLHPNTPNPATLILTVNAGPAPQRGTTRNRWSNTPLVNGTANPADLADVPATEQHANSNWYWTLLAIDEHDNATLNAWIRPSLTSTIVNLPDVPFANVAALDTDGLFDYDTLAVHAALIAPRAHIITLGPASTHANDAYTTPPTPGNTHSFNAGITLRDWYKTTITHLLAIRQPLS